MRRLWLAPFVLYVALTNAGCAPTSPPHPGASSAAITLDAATLRITAAAAYTEAAKIANETQALLNKKYPKRTTLEAARANYTERAAMNGDFVAALRNIAVPAETVREMHDVIERYTAVQALWMKGGDATSWAELDDLNQDLATAIREAAAAANLVRADLGLPLVPAD